MTSADSKGIIRWPNNPRAVVILVCHPVPFCRCPFFLGKWPHFSLWKSSKVNMATCRLTRLQLCPSLSRSLSPPCYPLSIDGSCYSVAMTKTMANNAPTENETFCFCLLQPSCPPASMYPPLALCSVCRVPRASGVKSLEKSVL